MRVPLEAGGYRPESIGVRKRFAKHRRQSFGLLLKNKFLHAKTTFTLAKQREHAKEFLVVRHADDRSACAGSENRGMHATAQDDIQQACQALVERRIVEFENGMTSLRQFFRNRPAYCGVVLVIDVISRQKDDMRIGVLDHAAEDLRRASDE